MAEWKSRAHLENHYAIHRREFPGYSIEQYDASAQETIVIGTCFTYRDRITGERRVGYFHRELSRFTCTDLDGSIRSHYRTDEAHVADLPHSTYQD